MKLAWPALALPTRWERLLDRLFPAATEASLLDSCRIMEAMLPTACLYGIDTGPMSLWLDTRVSATPRRGE
ncbi:hypothetical protein [Sodalis praecaptivus]|uniref:hypothetical protein n=1 Tax=Sodalis TaxID=84565 RepID=UPI00046C97B3|nr:hypothetical protein [Sodalis praecaptivus]